MVIIRDDRVCTYTLTYYKLTIISNVIASAIRCISLCAYTITTCVQRTYGYSILTITRVLDETDFDKWPMIYRRHILIQYRLIRTHVCVKMLIKNKKHLAPESHYMIFFSVVKNERFIYCCLEPERYPGSLSKRRTTRS